ncbi:MAG: putative rane protein [Pedosphaera sp.]|nr:putative rane protein [Pedosphaera sp.]
MKLQKAKCFGLVALVSCSLLPVYSQVTPPPTASAAPTAPAARAVSDATAVSANLSSNAAEVLKLAKSGMGDDVVLAYIQNSRTPYSLSVNDILALKNAGLSAPVLTAMLNHDSSLKNQPEQFTFDQKLYPPSNEAQAAPVAPAPAAVPTPTAPAIAAPALASQPAAPATVIASQAPPPAQVEVVPVMPGPDYAWTPGYWSWSRGGWIWVGGTWALRPRPGVVWREGHWGRHGRGYVWIGGGWH